MRWMMKEKDYPNKGDIRIIKRFAFLPIRIGAEKRWLETVYIEQRYERYGIFIFDPFDWFDQRFVTKADYDNYKEKSL